MCPSQRWLSSALPCTIYNACLPSTRLGSASTPLLSVLLQAVRVACPCPHTARCIFPASGRVPVTLSYGAGWYREKRLHNFTLVADSIASAAWARHPVARYAAVVAALSRTSTCPLQPWALYPGSGACSLALSFFFSISNLVKGQPGKLQVVQFMACRPLRSGWAATAAACDPAARPCLQEVGTGRGWTGGRTVGADFAPKYK